MSVFSKPHNIPTERVQIGPVLDVILHLHEARFCIDIMLESLFKGRTVSWVRTVNGINKYVTETSEEIPIENVQLDISTVRLVAKAKLRPKPVVNLSTNGLTRERKWIDIDPQPFDRSYFQVSQFLNRSLATLSRNCRKMLVLCNVQSNLGEFSGTRTRKEEKVSILLESLFVQYILVPPSNSRTFRRKFR